MKFHLNQNYKLLAHLGTLLVNFLKSPQLSEQDLMKVIWKFLDLRWVRCTCHSAAGGWDALKDADVLHLQIALQGQQKKKDFKLYHIEFLNTLAQNEDFLILVLQPSNKMSENSIVLVPFYMRAGFVVFASPIV